MNWHQIMDKALSELKKGGAEAAEPILLAALELTGGNLEFKAVTLFNLGLVSYDLHRKKETEAYFRSALEIIQERLPKLNELYGMYLKTFIEFYEKESRPADASKYYLTLIEHTRFMYGARHPYVANVVCEYCQLLTKTGNYAEAEKWYTRALDLMSAAKGQDHFANGAIHKELAICYEKLERMQDAQFHAGRAEQIEERRSKRGKVENQQAVIDGSTTEQSLD